MNLLKAVFEIWPGAGNLRLDVMFASYIGPLRVAHGAKQIVKLSNAITKRIVATTGAPGSNSVSFVRVYLASNQVGPISILFGTGENLGTSSLPVNLSGTGGVGQEASRFFDAILLPGEELYAQTNPTVNLVISQVWF